MASRIHPALDRAGAGQQAMGRYAAMFSHVAGGTFAPVLLQEVRERLTADGKSAPECMRQLNRILGFGELRTSAALLHFPIQSVTLWDFHVLFALDRWRRSAGSRVRGWFAALAESMLWPLSPRPAATTPSGRTRIVGGGRCSTRRGTRASADSCAPDESRMTCR